MKVLLVFIVLLLAIPAPAREMNRPVCVKGFERLVILSNAKEISPAGFDEAVVIADTLLRNNCYEYMVDRRGTVYAGASLSYLFGKVCSIRNTSDAIHAYIAYLNKHTDSAGTDEADYALEELFHTMSVVFIDSILRDSNYTYLFPRLAWGFLNNVYTMYGHLNRKTYANAFYKRYPMLATVDDSRKRVIEKLFAAIEAELE